MSIEQFKVLINNIIQLYKSSCIIKNSSSIHNNLLRNLNRSISMLLTEIYGPAISYEILNYIKDDSEYDIEELYGLIDVHSKLVTKDSAMTLWKLEEMYPHDEMFKYFKNFIANV